MPQFDQSSFLNQITWLTIMFTSFYLFATYILIPRLSSNIKFRKKKMDTHTSFNEDKHNETFLQKAILNAFQRAGYQKGIFFLKKIDNVNTNTLNNFKTTLLKKLTFNKNVVQFVTKNFCFPKKFKLDIK